MLEYTWKFLTDFKQIANTFKEIFFKKFNLFS